MDLVAALIMPIRDFARYGCATLGLGFWCCSSLAAGGIPPGEDAEADIVVRSPSDTATGSELLPPMTIMAPRFKPSMTSLEKYMLNMVLRFGALQWPVFNHEMMLTPERVPQRVRNSVYAVNVFGSGALAATPRIPVVSEVQSALGFGSSRSDHRVRSGGALDGLKPRVYQDRTLLNDPFDGSVHWAEVPDLGLSRAELVPGGGSSAWSEAPAGVIQLFSLPAMPRIVVDPTPPVNPDPHYAEPPRQTVHGTGMFAAELGTFGTRRLELAHTEPTEEGMLQVLGRISSSDGFVAAESGQRGTVDGPSWNRHRWLMTRWRQLLGSRAEVIATIKGAEASRGLGTLYQREHDRTRFASLEFVGRSVDGFAWSGTVSAGRRAGGRTFSVVDDQRSFERPAIDQFAEPVTSYAASFAGTWFGWNDSRTNFGADLRRNAGETRSRSQFSEGVFARETTAGGEQVTVGIFAIHNRKLGRRWRGMVGARLEAWQQTDGFVRNVNSISGAQLSDAPAPGLRGVEFSPSVGLGWEPLKRWRVRAAGQGSFRPPTLAERYRTFGDVNRIILSNAELKPEKSRHAEITVEYAPSQALTLAARCFANEIDHPVGTRRVTFELVEPIILGLPIGTVEYRTRVNFDRVRVRGTDLSVRYEKSKQLSIDAGIRLQSSDLSGVGGAVSSVAHDAPGVPDRIAFGGVSWRPVPKLSLRTRARWIGREFANEENTVHFGEAVRLDCWASYQVTTAVEIYLQADNIADNFVEAERGAEGTRIRTAPRMVVGGVRISW